MKKTSFGAIRWDAWYAEDPLENKASTQVQRSLSPREFHFRAPFFAEVVGEDKIIIPRYSQDEFDREMEYAMEAGIDYFAYVWYGQPGLRIARDLHLSSKYKNEVRLCACLDGNAIARDYAHEELLALFKDKVYKTVLDGRPLIYFFGGRDDDDFIKKDIDFYREACEKENIPTPYIAIMGYDAIRAKKAGADAATLYALGGRDGIPYSLLLKKTYVHWQESVHISEHGGADTIINVNGGWNNLPRHKNPVSWITGDLSRSWAECAQPHEIEEHFREAKRFMQDEKNLKACPANTAIIYAWNEHDEGGWICPTIAVDENGAQIYSPDGTPKINDERIYAIKRALEAK